MMMDILGDWDDPKYDVEYDVPPMYLNAPSFSFKKGFVLKPSEWVYLKNTEYGRGVFAAKDMSMGTLIEESPYIVVKAENIDMTLACYAFQEDETNCKIAFGYGSLFNHSYKPNMVISTDEENSTICFWAFRDIQKDEELTFSYSAETHP